MRSSARPIRFELMTFGFGSRPPYLTTGSIDVTARHAGAAHDTQVETNDVSRHTRTPTPEENRRACFDASAVLAAYESARDVAAFRAGVRR